MYHKCVEALKKSNVGIIHKALTMLRDDAYLKISPG